MLQYLKQECGVECRVSGDINVVFVCADGADTGNLFKRRWIVGRYKGLEMIFLDLKNY